jgi:predicted PurR-regulated permease PerM
VDRLRVWAYSLFVVLAAVALLRVTWLALQYVSTAVQVFLLGGVIAIVLEPLVRVLHRFLHSRIVAALVLLLILAAAVLGAGGFIALAALREAQALLAALPNVLQGAQRAFPGWIAWAQRAGIAVDPAAIEQAIISHMDNVGRGALTYTVAFVGAASQVVTVLSISVALAVYLLVDGGRLRAGLYNLLPAAWHHHLSHGERVFSTVVGGYIRGQLVVAGVLAALVGLGMWALGLPYPLLLGLQAGLFELLPIVGPILAAVAPVVLALGMPSPTLWYVIAYFVFAEQLEGNLLVPRISGASVGLHPVSAILAVVAGYEVAGMVGAAAAVPVVGMVWAMVRDYLHPESRPAPLSARSTPALRPTASPPSKRLRRPGG